jgi:ABC-2 type transport system permease protein
VYRVLLLMWKEFLELRQDPRIFPILFLAPVIQLTLLGYAATTDLVDVPILIVDADRSATSRDLVGRFAHSRYFRVIEVRTTAATVDSDLQAGRAWMALVVPTGFGRRIGRGETARVQIVADGSDANSVNVGLAYAAALVAEYGGEIEARASGQGAAVVDLRPRVWYNPELRSRHFMIPGVLALVLMVMTSVLSSMAIVREKETGTLEQLNVTPVARWHLIVGKLLPFVVIAFVDVLVVIAVARWWFEVPLRGNPALLVALSGVYLLSTLGIGLFVSTIARTQQQAMMTATFFFLMPMLYLSGFIFPIENMPAPIQPLTYLVPLRYYLVIVRGLFLKGVGLDVLWPDALALVAWGIAILTLAVARSTKRLQ